MKTSRNPPDDDAAGSETLDSYATTPLPFPADVGEVAPATTDTLGSLASAMETVAIDRLSAAWLVGQEIGAVEAIDDFEVVGESFVSSPWIHGRVWHLAPRWVRRMPPANLRTLNVLANLLASIPSSTLAALGRFLVAPASLHPDDETKSRLLLEHLRERWQLESRGSA